MNYILFDGDSHKTLLPLTFTRPVADIRIGIMTIREKWEHALKSSTSSITEDYLTEKFPLIVASENVLINGALLPNTELIKEIKSLNVNQALYHNNILLALHVTEEITQSFATLSKERIESKAEVVIINRSWQIFQLNDKAIRADFEVLTKGRKSLPISDTNKVLGAENIFIEEGAKVECAILNASTGPIYLAKDAEIMEGSIIRGPFALCEHSATKLGTKIYGATTIGPHSKVGGEVSNSVIFGYSNKAHDGFLGNSVLGEWCNLGADTNNSNLKNNYSQVKVWDYATQSYIDSGLQFCGLVMGDHSKSGINTMFNTGTVVGVCANIFGAGFPEKRIASFTWGGADGFVKFRQEEAFEVAARVYERRGLTLTEMDKNILKKVEALDGLN